MNQPLPESLLGYVLTIPRSDRWRIYHRLQELLIPCQCSVDGYLWVTVNSCAAAIQVRSVVQQFMTPRRELANWLERCWQVEFEEHPFE